ncbi:MAG: hypothetical protein LBR91_00725 [Puniceicoccales bacterium]|jgi:hypothetical protein|nr:hypothetical protein [Puniceicoccales bacterium]
MKNFFEFGKNKKKGSGNFSAGIRRVREYLAGRKDEAALADRHFRSKAEFATSAKKIPEKSTDSTSNQTTEIAKNMGTRMGKSLAAVSAGWHKFTDNFKRPTRKIAADLESPAETFTNQNGIEKIYKNMTRVTALLYELARSALPLIKSDAMRTLEHSKRTIGLLKSGVEKFWGQCKENSIKFASATYVASKKAVKFAGTTAVTAHALSANLVYNFASPMAKFAATAIDNFTEIFKKITTFCGTCIEKSQVKRTKAVLRGSAIFISKSAASVHHSMQAAIVNMLSATTKVMLLPFRALLAVYKCTKATIRTLWKCVIAAANAISSAIGKVANAICTLWKGLVATVNTICSIPKKFFNAIVAAVNSCIKFIKSTINSMIPLSVIFVRKVANGMSQIHGVLLKPAVTLPLIFSVAAFIGLKIYDDQISKIEYSRGVIMAQQAKRLLHQKRQTLYGSISESTSPKRKSSGRKLPSGIVSKQVQPSDDKFRQTVDKFFSNHAVSEVFCENGSCSMKIGDKIVGTYCALDNNSNIFIEYSDGEHIVFADLAGNKCVKSIESLFLK